MKSLTIFTPTFNRAYILPSLYESLCEQTCQDFIWIVVDDGSTDNTRELIEGWQNESKIEIKYRQQENGGKMRAHNRGVEMSETELFMCVDSDDRLASSMVVEDNLKFWALQKEQNFNGLISYDEISGLISYKEIPKIQSQFPEGVYCSPLGRLYDGGFRGDTTIMFKTDVLRKYPFPEIDGEKFITEAFVYDQIDQNHQLILFPYYSQYCEYREDGYSRNIFKVFWNNPKGYRMYYNLLVKIGKRPVKNITRYIGTSLLIRDHTTFKKSASPFLTLILYPIGILKFFKYKLMYRRFLRGEFVSI